MFLLNSFTGIKNDASLFFEPTSLISRYTKASRTFFSYIRLHNASQIANKDFKGALCFQGAIISISSPDNPLFSFVKEATQKATSPPPASTLNHKYKHYHNQTFSLNTYSYLIFSNYTRIDTYMVCIPIVLIKNCELQSEHCEDAEL